MRSLAGVGPIAQALPRLADPDVELASTNEIEEPRFGDGGGADVLELESLGPRDERPPQELVNQDDHRNHGDDRTDHRARIASIDGHAHVCPDTREPEV